MMEVKSNVSGHALLACALAGAVSASVSGCSISPKPEPPIAQSSLDVGQVVTKEPGSYGPGSIQGGPGAAHPAGATVRAFNLDDQLDPSDTTVGEDGSFTIDLDLEEGDEVRLQVLSALGRSAPIDVIVGPHDTSPQVAQRALGDCLLLEPALEIDLALAQWIQVNNTCAFGVELAQPTPRRPAWGLEVGGGSSWPAVLPGGQSLQVAVQFDGGAGTLEEIFFVTAIAPEHDRRPITALPAAP